MCPFVCPSLEISVTYEREGLISLWLYKGNYKLLYWNIYLLYIYKLRCFNFFNPYKKNYFDCAATKKIGKAKDLTAPLHILS
jgi:hypothetical protein